MLEQESVEAALELLGSVLAGRGLSYEVVAVGGSALLLRGLIRRPTKDLDVVALVVNGQYVSAEPMPDDMVEAVAGCG
jgi:hypothetical protein